MPDETVTPVDLANARILQARECLKYAELQIANAKIFLSAVEEYIATKLPPS